MKHLWERLTAATPPFWRKVRNLAASALIVVGGLLGEADKVGEEIARYLRYAFVACSCVAGTAQLTCQDSPKKDETPTDQPAA